jgi:hypothetical protein
MEPVRFADDRIEGKCANRADPRDLHEPPANIALAGQSSQLAIHRLLIDQQFLAQIEQIPQIVDERAGRPAKQLFDFGVDFSAEAT